jgi:hypothetical protein
MLVDYDSLVNEIVKGVIELSLSGSSGKSEGVEYPVTRDAVVM